MGASEVSRRMGYPASLLLKYKVLGRIGAGGMGTICRAQHLELDRPAAVKFLTEGSFAAHDPLLRFAEEARICSLLHHPNVVQVFDVDVECTPPYIVFELVEGTTLQAWLDGRQVLALGALLDFLAQIFDGLAHAHAKGVVHRDLKPANVLIDRASVPKVADFGLAKLASGDSSVKTKTGIVLGTPTYMAPEHARDREVGPSADLYSMGVMIFELLAGRLPFSARSDAEVLMAHIKQAAPRVREYAPSVPEPLDELIDELLRKEPGKRPADAGTVARRLRALKQDLAPDVRAAAVRLGVRRERVAGSRPAAPGPTLPSRRAGRGLTALASAIGAATRAAAARGGRRTLVLAAALLALGLLAAHRRSVTSLDEAANRRIDEFAVPYRSATAAVLTWRATWREERPLVRVTASGSEVPVTLGRVEVEEEAAPPGYRYVALLTGLKPGQRYRVAVDQGLGVEFQTPADALGLPGRLVELSADGALAVTYSGRMPFWAAASPAPAEATPALTGRARAPAVTQRMVWRLRDLLEQPCPLRVKIEPLEGAPMVLDQPAAALLVEELGQVAAEFEAERQKGAFYRRWSQGQWPNQLFRSAGWAWSHPADSSPATTQAAAAGLWRTVGADLGSGSRWYRLLAPLLPGLRALGDGPLGRTPALGAALNRARAPLWLLQGTAVAYRVPPNPDWTEALRGGGELGTVSFERPYVAEPRRVFDFRDEGSSDSHGQHYLRDPYSPVPLRDLFGRGPDASRPAVARRLATVDLGAFDPATCREAELELETQYAVPWAVPFVSFADGSFVAALPMSPEEAAAVDRRGREHRPAGSSRSTTGPPSTAPDEERRDRIRRYHRIPPSCLRPGTNTVELTVVVGPVDLWTWFTYAKLRLRLRLGPP